jgi:hypothetical protein
LAAAAFKINVDIENGPLLLSFITVFVIAAMGSRDGCKPMWAQYDHIDVRGINESTVLKVVFYPILDGLVRPAFFWELRRVLKAAAYMNAEGDYKTVACHIDSWKAWADTYGLQWRHHFRPSMKSATASGTDVDEASPEFECSTELMLIITAGQATQSRKVKVREAARSVLTALIQSACSSPELSGALRDHKLTEVDKCACADKRNNPECRHLRFFLAEV